MDNRCSEVKAPIRNPVYDVCMQCPYTVTSRMRDFGIHPLTNPGGKGNFCRDNGCHADSAIQQSKRIPGQPAEMLKSAICVKACNLALRLVNRNYNQPPSIARRCRSSEVWLWRARPRQSTKCSTRGEPFDLCFWGWCLLYSAWSIWNLATSRMKMYFFFLLHLERISLI